MSEKIAVTITATDGASKVFQQVASGAEKLDQSLDRAGDGFKDLSKDSETASRSLRDVDVNTRDIGIGIGILATGLALSGRAFRDQEVALRTLERGYGDAAAELEAFAEQIQETTNFSNDAAVEAANVFRTLSLNYGFTTAQIQELITISADLAATMGIGLYDAAFRVQSAMRGEAEAAEFLGLTLNDRALGLDRVSTSMSEAERAQIRFNALQEQSAFALGTAAEQADTTYGAMTQLRDGVQDAAQSFGGLIGPLGEVGAFASENAIQIAAMGLAAKGLKDGAVEIQRLTKAMTGFNLAAGAAKGGAAVLALAAAVGVLYVGYEALTQSGNVTTQGLEDIAAGAENAEQAITALAAAGDTLSSSLGQSAQNVLSTFGKDIQEMLRLSGEQATFQPGRANAEQQAAHEANMTRLRELEAQYGHWTTSAEEVADAEAGLLAVLTNSGTGRDLALEGLRKLNEEFDKGNISPETYASGIEMLGGQLDAYNFMANKAADSTTVLTEAQKEYNFELAKANQTLEDYQLNQQIGGQNLAGEHRDAADAIAKEEAALAGLVTTQQEAIQLNAAIQGGQRGVTDSTNDATDAIADMFGISRDLLGVSDDLTASLEELQTQYAETFAQMQADATRASDTLDSVFRAIVGNTDAIASQSQAVADWAEELVGAEGTWGQIDDLMAAGAITLDEYTAAQDAYNQIAAANVSIQEDVLSIQAQLAPRIAESTEALAAQFDELANGSTDAQLFALGMMDAATSSQALALAQGYLENQEVFGPAIVEAAQYNDMLAQVLEEMGLISYNPATGVVELLGVDESMTDLELLTSAMEDLDQTLATLIAVLQDDASQYITDVSGLIHELDGDTATVHANLSDNASGGISSVAQMIANLDGATATVYVNQQIQGALNPWAGLGGVIDNYATGGVVAGMAEWGPELLHFPNGGVALARNPGIYTVPSGTYVDTAPATAEKLSGMGGGFTLHIHGNVYGMDDLEHKVFESFSRAWTRGMRQHEQTMGAWG